MENYNYKKVCSDILNKLPERTKTVVSRRFGLEAPRHPVLAGGTGQAGETLESIGKSYGITRERVRQIEKDGFLKLRPVEEKYQNVFQYFSDELKTSGGLKREDALLSSLGSNKFQNEVYFLLTLGDPFERFPEDEKFHPFWTIDRSSVGSAQKVIDFFYNRMREIGQPISLEVEKPPIARLSPEAVLCYVDISKQIQKGPQGLFGLREWPEINPRGVKDKAYLVLKKVNKPLHFSQIADFIAKDLGQVNLHTVHNELIRDPRFILIGRGIYALRDWGYEPGFVHEVIIKTLKENKKPLAKEEIVAAVLKQRMIKPNTILLNLQNKKYFSRNEKGKYLIREN